MGEYWVLILGPSACQGSTLPLTTSPSQQTASNCSDSKPQRGIMSHEFGRLFSPEPAQLGWIIQDGFTLVCVANSGAVGHMFAAV